MTSSSSEGDKGKAHDVQRRRACLRCRMLKIKCSPEVPCVPCRVLSLCNCVRIRFVDSTVFNPAFDAPLWQTLSIPETNPETALERWIIDGAIDRWNQTRKSSISARARAASSSHTAMCSQKTVRHRRSAGAPTVAIPCPEIAELDQSDVMSENPESYLSMTDDIPGFSEQNLNDQPDSIMQFERHDGYNQPQQHRRRSVWVVRPMDGSDGLVNVRSRYRVTDGEDIRLCI
ncbi:hypothetical protein CONLIGDRAFT_495324 [Coniochaeta ligniaria NRRL 30616]|uniref:Zn(2)-C6 fungal-type domain-containing protein n=1 Tax=Coniochaeta ligniaria NRRL 30616 TaxID=1408157 RepID=A0A1J7JCW5_9PEZI|nr:hypothetical protein CONLIGDRAFT_495324 [Coniochaeta ligniaria NRRL 30616]